MRAGFRNARIRTATPFRTLKARLIEYADKQGMCGVFSSAVTGHPYTQRANIALGCVETGLELGYIPADLESVIRRAGDEQRQTVMNYFRTTSHNIACRLFIPAEHEAIIREPTGSSVWNGI